MYIPATASVQRLEFTEQNKQQQKKKWINTNCVSAGAWKSGPAYIQVFHFYMCVHMLVCVPVFVCVSRCWCVFTYHRLLAFHGCLWNEWLFCVCVCASLKLKVDLYYSTTCWQNAAILQTEPMLGWPRYCNSSSNSTQFAWHWMQPAGCSWTGCCSAGTVHALSGSLICHHSLKDRPACQCL